MMAWIRERVQEQDGEQHCIPCSLAAAPVPKPFSAVYVHVFVHLCIYTFRIINYGHNEIILFVPERKLKLLYLRVHPKVQASVMRTYRV